LRDYIDFMVSSEETGLEKPAPIMFELALKKLNVDAKDAAYFGDTLDRDIKGAANLGITPFWYIGERKVEDTEFDCVKIRSYHEIIGSSFFFNTKI